jgi:hypothetical protein
MANLNLVKKYKHDISTMYKQGIIEDIKSGRDLNAIICGYGATFNDEFFAFKEALESFDWFRALSRPVRPIHTKITPANFSPEYKPTKMNVSEDINFLDTLKVPEKVYSVEDAIKSKTHFGNVVKNILTKGISVKSMNKIVKRRALLQLVQKYEPMFTKEDLNSVITTCTPSVWFSVMHEPPKNPQARKDADLMQKLLYDIDSYGKY